MEHKISCAVTQDLMPLVKEGLASEESQALVKDHLQDCKICLVAFEAMSEGDSPAIQEDLPLDRVSRGIKKRRWKAVLLVSCLLLALTTAALSFVTEPLYHSYDEQQVSVKQGPEGVTITDARGGSILTRGMARTPENPGLVAMYVSFHTSRFNDSKQPSQVTVSLDGNPNLSIYYATPGKLDHLIYGPDPNPGGGSMELPRLALSAFLTIALGALLLLFLLWFVFCKTTRARRTIEVLLGLPICYLLGHLLIRGTGSATYHLTRDFVFIVVCALFLFLAWVLFVRNWQQRQEALKVA